MPQEEEVSAMTVEPFNPPRLCSPAALPHAPIHVADLKPEPCCCKHCTPAWVHLVGILRARGEVFEAKWLEELLGVHR